MFIKSQTTHSGPRRDGIWLWQGIYHRDLRMENLLLDGQYNSPNLKISDFAYSKNAVLDSQPKTNVGSPSYTPPELLLAVRNEGSAYDGAAIDVWSSGVILFFMLTGQLPFQVCFGAPPCSEPVKVLSCSFTYRRLVLGGHPLLHAHGAASPPGALLKHNPDTVVKPYSHSRGWECMPCSGHIHSDVWSLGVILFVMLTGQLPFQVCFRIPPCSIHTYLSQDDIRERGTSLGMPVCPRADMVH